LKKVENKVNSPFFKGRNLNPSKISSTLYFMGRKPTGRPTGRPPGKPGKRKNPIDITPQTRTQELAIRVPELVDNGQVKRCGAINRQNKLPCENAAGFRTKHFGEGKCFRHGGRRGEKNYKTGIYSKFKSHPRLQEYIDRAAAAKDPLDLIQDLHLTRGQLLWWLENFEEFNKALQSFRQWWTGKYRAEYNQIMILLRSDDEGKHASAVARLDILRTEMPPKPTAVLNPTDIVRLINTVANLVEKISAIKAKQQVPIEVIPEMQNKMALVVAQVLAKRFGAPLAREIATELGDKWRLVQVEY